MLQKVRPRKVAELIQRELAKIIQYDLRDPEKGFVTITRTKMTDDLSMCYVYFTAFGDKIQAEKSLKALNRGASFLRTKLSPILTMRKSPILKFFVDDTLENRNHIEGLLKRVEDDRIARENQAKTEPES